MSKYILAVDQGTTNTKAVLFDRAGQVVSESSFTTPVRYPQPGWAEIDGWKIWRAVRHVIEAVLDGVEASAVAALGITNQRESILLWDARSGEPVGPCVLWQCRRSYDICKRLIEAGHAPRIRAVTGLDVDPLFPATKIAWLLDNAPDARALAKAGNLRAGTVDSWLLWNLTNGAVHRTDFSNASRTQLFNLDRGVWDEEMAALFGIPPALLPQVMPSDGLFGETAAGACALPGGVPIRAMMGDSHAALYGHGLTDPGQIKVTCGTGSSLMMFTGDRVRSQHGLSETIAWNKTGRSCFALEGNILVSGHAIAFAKQLLGCADEIRLTELALSVADSDGVSFVPALAGMGAPHWSPDARGTIAGMTLSSTPAHLARATFEAVALQIRDVLVAMEADLGRAVSFISVDGGATKNELLMQLLCDLTDRRVVRPKSVGVSAFGVARMAGEAVGVTMSPATDAGAIFEPAMHSVQREKIVSAWCKTVARAKL